MISDAIKLNESGGKLFEILSEMMLEDIFGKKQVFPQPKCPQMLIAPDIFIKSETKPSHIVMVTHATAKNAAGVKVDRTSEELFEAKTKIYPPPMSINLIWHSPIGWAKGHLDRLEEMFDCSWIAFNDCMDYTKALPKMIEVANHISGCDREKSASIARASNLSKHFMRSLKDKLSRASHKNDSLWAHEIRRLKAFSRPPIVPINTEVKDDLISLCVIPAEDLAELLQRKRLPFSSKHQIGINAGGLTRTKSLRGDGVAIEANLYSRIDPIACQLTPQGVVGMVKDISESEGYSQFLTTYEAEHKKLARINLIARAVKQRSLHSLVADCWKKSSDLYTGRCWPFDIASGLIKSLVNEDFGLLNIQREALGDNRAGFKWDSLVWFINGDTTALPNKDLRAIAAKFESYLAKTDLSDPEKLLEDLLYWQKMSVQKNKTGNPLPWLVRHTLLRGKIPFIGFPDSGISTYCPFAAKAGAAKVSGVTRWHFFVNEEKILHVLTNYSTTHKHKEYSAKTRIAHHIWNGTDYDLSQIQHIGFVLDGEWSEDEVGMFIDAGAHVFPANNPNAWVEWAKMK